MRSFCSFSRRRLSVRWRRWIDRSLVFAFGWVLLGGRGSYVELRRVRMLCVVMCVFDIRLLGRLVVVRFSLFIFWFICLGGGFFEWFYRFLFRCRRGGSSFVFYSNIRRGRFNDLF